MNETDDAAVPVPTAGKVVGIDWGAARIGIAVCDETQTLATPHTTLHDKDKGRQITVVVELAHSLGAVGFVVGLPLEEDGSEGPTTRATHKYSEKLGAVSGLPVARMDERYSSVEAAERLANAGAAKQRRGETLHAWKGRLDAAAAAVILQDWLDARKGAAPGT